jgi:hypothetical protein
MDRRGVYQKMNIFQKTLKSFVVYDIITKSKNIMQHKTSSKGRGTTLAELKLLCSLFMSDDHGDDSVLDKNGEGSQDSIVQDWLDAQSRAHGYDSWVVAYHEIDKP